MVFKLITKALFFSHRYMRKVEASRLANISGKYFNHLLHNGKYINGMYAIPNYMYMHIVCTLINVVFKLVTKALFSLLLFLT